MRISDWSSDVCSSDLLDGAVREAPQGHRQQHGLARAADRAIAHADAQRGDRDLVHGCAGIHDGAFAGARRSEEHTSELQSLMRISYAVFCLKKITHNKNTIHIALHNHIDSNVL